MLFGSKESAKIELFEKYKLLIAARNFHYENFNKWLTYFYVANAAIFLGYIQIITSKETECPEKYQFAILSLGLIAGILLYWSSKGYYYWNINYILLVNYYEKELLGWKERERIYSMFANKNEQNSFASPVSGANFSTSKIAILFSFIIATSWGALIINYTEILSKIPFINQFDSDLIIPILLSGLLLIGVSWLFGLGKNHILWSNTDPLHDLEINQKKPSTNRDIIS
ncbi:RipA family octameric membrane protein [Algoriphagus machipongonensis]|uniref:Uncharacterized protein n=1 Tax=Algoriphagus machipongonensis TaxID=388413 RepID=A3HT85_9BACT|nr:hypothetical protein [Algoriphagus machipongonensis]EAZ83053.2 hypothetical protein ALPR1_12570 [Algoriphagus machipongonensis]